MQNGTNLKQFKSIKRMDFSGSCDDIKSVHSINSYITFKGAMCYYITMDFYINGKLNTLLIFYCISSKTVKLTKLLRSSARTVAIAWVG